MVAGNAGDHKLVYALLRAAGQAPAYEEFLNWLDEPTYEPCDRLLAKLGSQIVAQLQVRRRDAWFHGIRLPVASVECLAILPEYEAAEYEQRLLAAAERAMRDSRAVAAFAMTDRPEAFRARGWSEIGWPRYTEANVHEVLAQLPPPLDRRRRRAESLRIRRWRQVELEALSDVYRKFASVTWGGIDRSEAYWRWLVGRGAHDELIVAIDGRDDFDSLETPPHIVGYAVSRGSQVFELATLGGWQRAAELLLARACQDAIEHDHHTISLHTPSTDPLHQRLLSAGGDWSNGRNGGTWLVSLLDPFGWVERLSALLLERAAAARLDLPRRMVIDTGRRKYCLELARHDAHLKLDRAAVADASCTPSLCDELLLGIVDSAAAWQLGELVVRDESVAQALATLFPPTACWQSHFDMLRS